MQSKQALPTIEKTLPCLKCGAHTTQRLAPSKAGCAWVCVSCKNPTHAFSHEDMMKTVIRGLFKVPSNPVPVKVPEKFKVFLKSKVADNGEKEVERQFIEEHARLTGHLPQVGKPLFTSPRGLADAPSFMAIPYGEVIRIETSE